MAGVGVAVVGLGFALGPVGVAAYFGSKTAVAFLSGGAVKGVICVASFSIGAGGAYYGKKKFYDVGNLMAELQNLKLEDEGRAQCETFLNSYQAYQTERGEFAKQVTQDESQCVFDILGSFGLKNEKSLPTCKEEFFSLHTPGSHEFRWKDLFSRNPRLSTQNQELI